MPDEDLLSIFDREQRREVDYPDATREELPDLVRQVIPGRKKIVIQWSDLSADNAEAVIRREVEHAASLGYDLSWKAYAHDRPADLRDRLVAHGFAAQDLEAVLVLDLAQAPAWLLDPATPAAVDIRLVTGRGQIADVVVVEFEVWQEDSDWLYDLADELETAPAGLSMYVAYDQGAPASAAWVRFHERGQFASLWGGSTRAAYRGRGLYTALLAIRAQEARRRGLRYLTIDASPMSQPIVEKYGFQLITYAQDHDRKA